MTTMRLTFFILILIEAIYSNPLIKLPTGWIRGRQDKTYQNTSYYAFEKIPYAKPPLGELRFQSPQPPDSWEGVLNTTNLDKICYQLTRPGPESEDCLYLNVFTTKLPQGDDSLLPVMFYIHGGGFYDGTARNLGSDRYIDSGLIYVAVNYRMGPFGFLWTGDNLTSGNNGLKDQLLALRWVRDNIRLFGGDPEKITIFGHSAGGASVSYFLLNKKTEGLYNRVICQSGTALGIWALQRNPKSSALAFAKYLNKSSPEILEDTERLISYLQKVPAEELKKASFDFYFNHIFKNKPEDMSALQGTYFGPVIEKNSEDAFITEKMYQSFRHGKVVKVPLMIGITSEECLEYYKNYNKSVTILDMYDNNLNYLIPPSMRTGNQEVGKLIREMYTDGDPFSQHVADGIRFSSDNLLTRSTIKQAELYSKFAPTYFYVFSYDGELGRISTHYDGAGRVGHGEENSYLMCSKSTCDLGTYPEEDKLMQKKLLTLWTNFAKFGNPTPDKVEGVTWPPLTVENGDFFYMDINNKLSVQNHAKETYQKWEKLYKSLGFDDFDTY